jgi:hypothetical protein
MMWFPIYVLSLCIPLAKTVFLPSVHVEASSPLKSSPGWWAQVGDKVYYAPPTSFLGLSQNVSDYYYMQGSPSALTDKIKKHLVGSEGKWHIMHLPYGPSMLEISHASGDRRASFSRLNRLRHGTVLASGYPPFDLLADYVNPLDNTQKALEKAGVDAITPESSMGFLKKLTDFPTRSYSNSTASNQVEHWLKSEFEAMGLTTCFHTFASNSNQLTNVIARVPGTTQSTVTVGAHYDSRPFDGPAPGAEDNGSGVAGLLAMAKAFTLTKVQPKHTVNFVAFAGEEPGLIGSQHYADALKNGGEGLPAECRSQSDSFLQLNSNRKGRSTSAVNRAIIMDEIGWASPNYKKLTVNLESYDTLGRNVMNHMRHSVADHLGDSIDVVHNSGPYGSDHMSFLSNDMECALTINGDDEGYPFYHKSGDTIDNVNADLLTKTAKMNYGALMRMAMV